MVSFLLVLACATEPTPPPPPTNPELAVDLDAPTACGACHEAVVAEWEESMHARSHHERDPVYAGMRSLRMARQGAQVADKCAKCHTPRSPEDPASPAALAGVSCATCHAVEAIEEGELGADALRFSEAGLLRGPHSIEAGASPVHGTGDAAPWLGDGTTICLVCHDAMRNPAGAPTCTTGPEHAAARAGSCVSCHMPELPSPSGSTSQRDSHRSHAFLGPHRAWYQDDPSFFASAIELKGELQGRTLRASLRHRAGHAFPTGFPGRLAIVRAIGQDAEGEEIWRSFQNDPLTEDPQAVLRRVYVDAEGKPTMPPFAERLAKDHWVPADGRWEHQWTLPPGVERVQLELLYALLPGKVAPLLGLEGAPEARPRRVVQNEIRRSP